MAESKLYKFMDDFRWEDVPVRKYKSDPGGGKADPPTGGWSDVTRHTITGHNDEQTAFHLRYFEVAPGGYTSHEKHRQEHVVIGARGVGRVIVGNNLYTLTPNDILYISSETPHQFRNESDEPFGFFCIVDAERDKPKAEKRKSKHEMGRE